MDAGISFCLIFILAGVAVADWKPGKCPIVDSYQGGICVEECSIDFDCNGNQKCCNNGCGMTCQYAKEIGVPHGGLCPAVNDSVPAMCIDPPPCDIDQDCMAWQKCCFTGCSFECVAPERLEENRLGLCPAEAQSVFDHTRYEGTMPNCSTSLTSCSDDRDCTEDHKCCSDVCGRTCIEPVYACYYNGHIYQNKEDIIDSDGCSGCTCLDGYLACKQDYCDSVIDKIRILTLCLIVLGVVCLAGAVLSFVKYQHSKRSFQDKNKNKKEAVNMMKDDEIDIVHLPPTKV